MKLIKPGYVIEEIDGKSMIQRIEKAGRTCYKSEDRITENSAEEFVKMIIKRGHESVLEHEKVTVRIICDRGVSHELVRHRIASFSQESTRYCNYGSDHIVFIIPPWLDLAEVTINSEQLVNEQDYFKDEELEIWLTSLATSEVAYQGLIEKGWQPQQARLVLPNSLKTEIVITANFREWRLIFKQRTAQAAHPQMREIIQPMLDEFKIKIPVIFDDINYG